MFSEGLTSLLTSFLYEDPQLNFKRHLKNALFEIKSIEQDLTSDQGRK